MEKEKETDISHSKNSCVFSVKVILEYHNQTDFHLSQNLVYCLWSLYFLGKTVSKADGNLEPGLAGIGPSGPDRQYILTYQAFYIG